jgi:ABC-type nitrate/sulfonate/bicarbonate transport system permease component
MTIARASRWFLPLALLLLGFTTWEIAVRVADTPRWMLPPPTAILRSFVDDRELLFDNAKVTLLEVVLGFVYALGIGVGVGIAIASSRILERALYPIIIASQTIPLVALAPLLLIWFGYGLAPKIIVTTLVCFFPIAVSTVDGLRAVDREVIAMLRTFGAGKWRRFWIASVPSALPSLFSGIRVAITFSVIGAVFGELVGASEGLGYLMQRAAAQFQTARVFAALFILAGMGIGLFALATLVERLVLPWRRYLQEDRYD